MTAPTRAKALREQGAEQRKSDFNNAPNLPDVARSILKALICSLATTGLITNADAENLLALLELRDA